MFCYNRFHIDNHGLLSFFDNLLQIISVNSRIHLDYEISNIKLE